MNGILHNSTKHRGNRREVIHSLPHSEIFSGSEFSGAKSVDKYRGNGYND